MFESKSEEVYKNSLNIGKAMINSLRKTIDCTIHIEVEQNQRVLVFNFVNIEKIKSLRYFMLSNRL